MRVVVTGAGGFLGQYLVPELLKAGHEVACLSRYPHKLPKGWKDIPSEKVEITGQGIRRLLSGFRPEVVVHLATSYLYNHRFEDIRPMIEANLLLGGYLLEAMHDSGCSGMVWAGTSWQHYEGANYRPVNLYAATKQAFTTLAEYYRDALGIRMIELHLYDSYGQNDPRHRLLTLLQKAAKMDEPLMMSGGEQRLHLIHIKDLAAAFVMACEQVLRLREGERRVYRLPSPRAVTLKELVKTFNTANPENAVQVVWGALPYRQLEVFQPWENAPILPGWKPKIDLLEGLRNLRGV